MSNAPGDDEPQFSAPGPGAPSAGDPDPQQRQTPGPLQPPAPYPTAAHGDPAPESAQPPTPQTYGARWGAPGGPTPEEQAAARRRARIWVLSVVAGILLFVGVVAAVSYSTSQAATTAWEPVPVDLAEPRDVNAVQLVLGSCVAEVPDGATAVGRVRAVPCEDEHAGEVVGRVDASAAAVWPGSEATVARAAQSCTAGLLGPRARDEADDELTFLVWTPSEASWAAGDRTSLCVAATTAPRTGSLLE